jgi:hypothetical protein
MGFNINIPQQKSDADPICDYDKNINEAERARNNQYKDTAPGIQKEGYLGVDDIDRLRRRHIKKFY